MGLIVLDAGIVIAALDAADARHAAAVAALRAAGTAGDRLVVPASAYAEALVAPSRRGADAVATLDAFLDALGATIEPASRDVARRAATVRAVYGPSLRLPDALVLATGDVLDADVILTTDARWPDTGITVKIVGSER
ncbi:MAG: type II toxin-antitoxin system VapC family toxin [Chloroflexota bacterium]